MCSANIPAYATTYNPSSSTYASSSSYEEKAYSDDEVASTIVEISKKHAIPSDVLFALVSVESDFEPLAIAVETTRASAEILEKLRSPSIKVVFGDRRTFHSQKSVISVYPSDRETAHFIIGALKQQGFCFDVGLMQINTVNFKLSETDALFDPKNNLNKAATVIGHCKKAFRSLKNQIECYNRGAGNLAAALRRAKKSKKPMRYPYWKRFKEDYVSYFGKEALKIRIKEGL